MSISPVSGWAVLWGLAFLLAAINMLRHFHTLAMTRGCTGYVPSTSTPRKLVTAWLVLVLLACVPVLVAFTR